MDIYVTREGEPTRRLTRATRTSAVQCSRLMVSDSRTSRCRFRRIPRPVHRRPAAGRGRGLGDPEMRVLLPASESYGVKLNIGVPCPSGHRTEADSPTWPIRRSPISPRRRAELRVSTLDGQERVVSSGRPADPEGPFAWSPDGDAIAYRGSRRGLGCPAGWRRAVARVAPGRRTTRPSVSWSSQGELAVTVQTDVPSRAADSDVLVGPRRRRRYGQ